MDVVSGSTCECERGCDLKMGALVEVVVVVLDGRLVVVVVVVVVVVLVVLVVVGFAVGGGVS